MSAVKIPLCFDSALLVVDCFLRGFTLSKSCVPRNTKVRSHPETESKDDEKTTRKDATNETTTEKDADKDEEEVDERTQQRRQ